MSRSFLQLLPVEEALARLDRFRPVSRRERVGLTAACGRVLAGAVASSEPVPAFARSLMDGFAVRSGDVASARETAPVFLRRIGAVEMGRPAGLTIRSSQAAAVPTGAMLPEGADAVVMLEHSRELAGGQVEILRASAAGEHVLAAGEDLLPGASLCAAGQRLEPLDVGALAACGAVEVEVFCRPRVAVLSTGDELVDAAARPGPGQVRDTNALVLAAQVIRAGGEALLCGRVPDEPGALIRTTRQAREQADLVLLSGGSSVGVRDHTAAVLAELSGVELLIAGVAISPGKPTLLADLDGVAAFGMPGHPVSSFVVFHVLVAPLVERLAGLCGRGRRPTVRGRLADNAPAAPGRETWLRVRLERETDGEQRVVPLAGSSAVYTSLLRSDGLLRIPAGQEGWAAGEEVDVELLRWS
ncbi:MAG: molybdopterin molybdotransferase MoeA [Deltaproteobacteria bacterium]|nr:molybdopterin molybdotransferase MoeA [Deltaproteobacteria bacterium]